MKKLEKLLNKMTNVMKYIRDNPWIFEASITLIFLLFWEILGIFVAVQSNNYMTLSICTYIWTWMISEVIVEKIFFEKLNCYLMKIPKTTSLIFWILFVAAIVSSWSHFEAFIFIIILAFMHGDYNKTEKKIEES